MPRTIRFLSLVTVCFRLNANSAYLCLFNSNPNVIWLGCGAWFNFYSDFSIAAPIRLTYLGISEAPKDILEAGQSFGATKRQILFRIELPAAASSIAAGVTQCIMLSLSMVVIAALTGLLARWRFFSADVANSQDINELSSAPTCVAADTTMENVMEIRYHTDHAVFSLKDLDKDLDDEMKQSDEKIQGVISDKELYHALLGKMMLDD